MLAFARMQMASLFAYRAGYVLAMVVLLLQLLLLVVVWRAIYADRGDVAGVSLATTTAYAALALVQFTVLNPFRASVFPQHVREGRIAIDLIRPVGLPMQMIAGQLGSAAAMTIAALPAIPIACLIGSVPLPTSWQAAAGYVTLLLGAVVLNQLMLFLVNLACLWTLETSGVSLLFRLVSQFFSGAVLPLWFMPDMLRAVTDALPFSSVVYVPAAVYLGEITGTAILVALAQQFAWIVVMVALAALGWSRASRRIISQGG